MSNKEYQQLINRLTKHYNRKASSQISRTRGHLGELMTTMLFPKALRNEVIVDRVTFQTPFGERRIDNFHPRLLVAIESKNTRVVARKSIRLQITKDAYLLKEKVCKEITWVLFRGASAKVLSLLDSAGIACINLYDAYFEEVMKKEVDPDDLEIIEV